MFSTYRVTGGVAVLDHEPGSEFEHEFTAEAEADLLAAGGIGILPRAYRVIGTSRVFDTEPDGEFLAALTIGHEAQLVAGGHIARVEPAAVKPKGKKSAKDTEPD